jgi:ferrous iron transport protein B
MTPHTNIPQCKSGEATLASMRAGSKGKVSAIAGGDFLRKRLSAMGIYEGREVRKISTAPGGAVVVEATGCQVALGRHICEHISVATAPCGILLTGNPNVGKSVVFSRLTGIGAISSNYPGTTVEYLRGTARLAGEPCVITDVPGAYSLETTCKAEDVACEILGQNDGSLIIHVLDSTSLERNLYFAMEVLALKRPTIILLNKWDIAKMRGIMIDPAALAQMLGVPCIPFVAVTGEGLPELEKRVAASQRGELELPADMPATPDEKWKRIGEISRRAQQIVHRHPSLIEKIAELSIRPATGLPIAFALLTACFYFVRFIGEGLINHLLDPLYMKFYFPFVKSFAPDSAGFIPHFFLGGAGGPMDSFGVLTTGVYIALVSVFAYVLAFYAALGFMEDTGYIPRLAVLMDAALHKIGLHGYASVPILLGLGCKVPGILATRVLESRREKVIALSLVLLAAPCMPQSAMIVSLLARHGFSYVLAVFGTLILTGGAAGYFLHRMMKGDTPELFVEIPPWQWPRREAFFAKLFIRIKSYTLEAVPMIMLGVAIVSLADGMGAVDWVGRIFEKPVTLLLGLPKETVSVMVLGFLRKDVSIALLVPFALTPWQVVVASVFLAGYLPCIASFTTLTHEVGVKDAMIVVALNFTAALGVASLLHFLHGF